MQGAYLLPKAAGFQGAVLRALIAAVLLPAQLFLVLGKLIMVSRCTCEMSRAMSREPGAWVEGESGAPWVI